MFVPIVPFVPSMTSNRNTVINKTIVYSDTVLNLNEIGNNIKVTCISDVKEYDFERCLKLIFESNNDVEFNTIQYSKQDNKVYFYANKEIDVSNWEENKTFKYEPITNKEELLKEFKNILSCGKTSNPDVISINYVYDVLYKYVNEYKEIVEKYETKMKYILRSVYSNYSYCCIHDFNYEGKKLPISFKKYSSDSAFDELEFSKNNDDLYVTKSSTVLYKDDYINNLGEIISELYDELLKYEYLEDYKFGINLANSNLYIDVSKYVVTLADNSLWVNRDFETRKRISNNSFEYECNSNAVISAIKGNEEELFKRIYVNIDDCPEWMREELSVLRYNELKNEEEKIRKLQEQKDIEEYERILKNRRQQKILSLKHKLFPWMKK